MATGFHLLDRRDDADHLIEFFQGCVNPNCSPLIFRALISQFLTACARPQLLKQFFSNTLGTYVLDSASTAMFSEVLRCRIAASPADVFHFAAKFREELAGEATNTGRHHWSRSLVWTSLTQRVGRLFAPQSLITFEDHEELLAQFQTYARLCLDKIWRSLIDFKFPMDVQRNLSDAHGSLNSLQNEILFQGLWKAVLQPAQDLVQCFQLFEKYKTLFTTVQQMRLQREEEELRAQGINLDEFATFTDVESELNTLVWFAAVQLSMASMTNFLLVGEIECLDTCLMALPRMANNTFTWDPKRMFILPTLFVGLQCCKVLKAEDSPVSVPGRPISFQSSGPAAAARGVHEAAMLLAEVLHQSPFVDMERSGYMEEVILSQPFFSIREECRLACNVAAIYIAITRACCCGDVPMEPVDFGLTLLEFLVDTRNLCQHFRMAASNNRASALLPGTFNNLHLLARLPATIQAMLYLVLTDPEARELGGEFPHDGDAFGAQTGSLIADVCTLAMDCLDACSRRHGVAKYLLQKARMQRQSMTFFSREVRVNPQIVALFSTASQDFRTPDDLTFEENEQQEQRQPYESISGQVDLAGLYSNVPGLPEQMQFQPSNADSLDFHTDFNLHGNGEHKL